MKKIVLQACCAPCASYPIIKLIEDNYIPVIFFYNLNIYPLAEYEIRRNELKNYCSKIGVEFFEGDYETDLFYEKVKGLENEPEKGKRCYKCYELRIEETAHIAEKLNFPYFCTTLTLSPHKNSNWINEIGEKLNKKYKSNYLYSDFKKKNGYKRSIELSKKYDLYRQNFCGCAFSKAEAECRLKGEAGTANHKELLEK